ncbi:PspA/IM30 family protein [Paenibacillus sp. BSR1-1]|uniref:PspA/IM30 family protein n=1 Tax=Paenibacillus sp. BSR1-1 TaxID=3020845 RepID=UPI0025AF05B3|nr:PspA/IM30 family protein [Paenibacillus sp. BSR1-1]MDN3018887.1 PspA/IM30 family protein [Paenibacillus sp. BSR1-1]
MGIFNRVKTIVMADLHELLDKVEDPISLLNQYMRELDEQVEKAKETLGHQLYLEKRHELLVAEASAVVAKRTRQAELAVEKGEDTIARLALQEKLQQEAKLKLFQEQHAAMKQQTLALREQIDTLVEKYNELSNRRLVLISRAHAAKAQQQLQKAVASFSTDNALKGFRRVEDYVQQLEAQASAASYFIPSAPTVNLELQEAVEREFALLKESK